MRKPHQWTLYQESRIRYMEDERFGNVFNETDIIEALRQITKNCEKKTEKKVAIF